MRFLFCLDLSLHACAGIFFGILIFGTNTVLVSVKREIPTLLQYLWLSSIINLQLLLDDPMQSQGQTLKIQRKPS